ncbi:MAG: gas vesicle protein K [Deltaproteobacteria bacterium]|nr:gas vesicle protein K [Deltaproteobacteria bacterium]
MAINLDENNLRQGLMCLVVALVDIIKDVLKHQAVRRMESGSLSEGEIERLGKALMAIDKEVENIKKDFGIGESVDSVKEGLDDAVNRMLCSAFSSAAKEERGERVIV